MIVIPTLEPQEKLASIALDTASKLGATVVQFRVAVHDSRGVSLRDGEVENIGADTSIAMSVRVVHSGAWGFAATTDLSIPGAIDAANRAIQMAKLSSLVASEAVTLAPEPVHGVQTWTLPIEIDAFAKSDEEIVAFFNINLL